MTPSSHVTPNVDHQLPVLLSTARRVSWLILALCILVAGIGVVWLGVLYIASLVQLPDTYAHLAKSISETQDISALKSACLSLARFDESDRISRRNWIVMAPTLAFILAFVVGALSVWLLFALRRVEKFIGVLRETKVG
ncbi:hypothetical protein D9M71_588900 [compost metagenome]